MKRLTKRTVAGTANIDYEGCTFSNGEEDYIVKSARRQLAIERLAAIEDILCDGEDEDEYDLDRLAVMCNQRMSMRDEVSERFSLTAKMPLDRLREIAEAERDGRCVVLPCKRDDVLWTFQTYPSERIYSFHVTDVSTLNGRTMLNTDIMGVVDARDVGKTVFLTRAEAEEALKAREQDG